MMGPREEAVRATLTERPAGVFWRDAALDDELLRKVAHCFAGLHNGAMSEGHLNSRGGLFLGKAECEWDWREVWPAMAQMGLVEYHVIPRPNHPDVGEFTALFRWGVTEHGRAVREDDNKYFDELMDAMRADREAAGAEDRRN